MVDRLSKFLVVDRLSKSTENLEKEKNIPIQYGVIKHRHPESNEGHVKVVSLTYPATVECSSEGIAVFSPSSYLCYTCI